MINLPNQCYCSELNVFPKNWKSNKVSAKKDWYITYRFYDPTFVNSFKYKKGKLTMVKGMNHLKTTTERQTETEIIIDKELQRLKGGFNPILNKYSGHFIPISLVDSNTGFLEALTKVEQTIKAAESTKRDFKSILRFVSTASMQLGIAEIPISLIRRKHIKTLLMKIESNQLKESPHRYNKIRSYLMILFTELIELEAVDSNPLKDLSKMKTTQRLRNILSQTQREQVHEYLKNNHYRFWLFTNIFFHSGTRLTELMNVKAHHVNLNKQTFVVTIKKGQQYKEVSKPIKNIAIEFWKEAIKTADPDDYIFSKGLHPGKDKIQSFQITKRWNRLIKSKLGIREDFYSLKHLNLDETAAILSLEDASALASHTSSIITAKHYTINESSRQMERLKLLENKLA